MTATKQSTKRIHKVTIKRMIDESPDTSWLGEYANRPTSEFSIDRAHDLDCASQEYNQPNDEGKTHLASAIHYLNTSYNESSDEWDVCSAMELLENVNVCDCGERGDMERYEYRYFNPSFNYVDKDGRAKDLTPEEVRKYTRQDYERMERLNRGDWGFIGIRAEAEVSLTGDIKTGVLLQDVTSGGLWGIESDSSREHIESIEAEELASLREQLHAIGFSSRAISAAFKNIEREDN